MARGKHVEAQQVAILQWKKLAKQKAHPAPKAIPVSPIILP
jgi:hypothetical protein